MDSAQPPPPDFVANVHKGTPQEIISLRRFLTATAILALVFSLPLYRVMAFALKSAFFSYIVLVPLISGYLAWIERAEYFPAGRPVHPAWPVIFWAAGVGVLVWAGLLFFEEGQPDPTDLLALSMYALVLLICGFACYFLGRQTLRFLAFPLGFLIFLAPFPAAVESTLESTLQHGSAAVAEAFFNIAQMPVLRDGTLLHLPGFPIQVAPECSGIRSTMALFLTSLVAGKLFLRSPWKCVILALFVIPLAFLRNGFRVFVIGELCVQIGPHMIDSWIHHHGGPVFFALSLLPFSVILYFLYKSEHPTPKAVSPTPN